MKPDDGGACGSVLNNLLSFFIPLTHLLEKCSYGLQIYILEISNNVISFMTVRILPFQLHSPPIPHHFHPSPISLHQAGFFTSKLYHTMVLAQTSDTILLADTLSNGLGP